MEYRKLGKTGLEIGEIALGCEGFIGKAVPRRTVCLGSRSMAG